MDGLLTNSLLALAAGEAGLAILGAGLGCGLIIIGAGKGIGEIGGKAADAVARQPEAHGHIFLTTIITAAMIEGITFFALIICFMILSKMSGTGAA
jgi:F-type H+-transporting ATPase subunit c